jgi:hypothetical protein
MCRTKLHIDESFCPDPVESTWKARIVYWSSPCSRLYVASAEASEYGDLEAENSNTETW